MLQLTTWTYFYFSLFFFLKQSRKEKKLTSKIINKFVEFASHFPTTVSVEYDSLPSLPQWEDKNPHWTILGKVIGRQIIATNQIRKQFKLKWAFFFCSLILTNESRREEKKTSEEEE